MKSKYFKNLKTRNCAIIKDQNRGLTAVGEQHQGLRVKMESWRHSPISLPQGWGEGEGLGIKRSQSICCS